MMRPRSTSRTLTLVMPYERLKAWQACHALLETYRVTGSFLRSELYGLTTQMRQATVDWVTWSNTRRLLEPIRHAPAAEYEAARTVARTPQRNGRHSRQELSRKPGAIQSRSNHACRSHSR